MFQRTAQHFFVNGQQPVEQRVFDLAGPAQHRAARGGHDGQSHHQRSAQGVADGQCHIGQQVTGHTVGKQDGHKHADGGQGGGNDGRGHLPCALHGRPRRRNAPGAQAVDVFDDDDGVVHQHTDAQRQTGQADDVQRNAAEIHQHNGEQHAQRNADSHHQCGAHVLEEQRQHDDRQQCAADQIAQHVFDDQTDVFALVHNGDHAQLLVLVHQRGGAGVAGVAHLAGGGGGALENRQQHRLLPVHPGVGIVGVVGHHNVGHVTQTHIAHAVDIAQQGAFQFVHAFKGLAHFDQIGGIAVPNGAGGHREVLRANDLRQSAHIEKLVQIGVGQRFLAGVIVLGPGVLQLLSGGIQLLFAGFQLGLAGIKLLFGAFQGGQPRGDLGAAAAKACGGRNFACFQLLVRFAKLGGLGFQFLFGALQRFHLLGGLLLLFEQVGQGGGVYGVKLQHLVGGQRQNGGKGLFLLLGQRQGVDGVLPQGQVGFHGGLLAVAQKRGHTAGQRVKLGQKCFQLGFEGQRLHQTLQCGQLFLGQTGGLGGGKLLPGVVRRGVPGGGHGGVQLFQLGGKLLGQRGFHGAETGVQLGVALVGLLQLGHGFVQRLFLGLSALDLHIGGRDGGHALVELLAQLRQPGGGVLLLGLQFLFGVLQLFFSVRQVGFAVVQLLAAVRQLGGIFVQFLLGVLQLLFGVGQTVADLDKQLVVDLVDLGLVQAHLHGFFDQAHSGNAGHTVHTFQRGNHGVLHIVGQFINVHSVVADRHIFGGHHIGADFHDGGGGGPVRQRIGQLVDGGAHLDHGAVHIGIVGKFQRDKAVVFVAGAGHVFNTVDGAQCLLQRGREFILHFFGAGAGVGGNDHQIGQADAGQQVGGHTAQADCAKYQHQDHAHQYGKGFFHALFRDHRSSPLIGRIIPNDSTRPERN